MAIKRAIVTALSMTSLVFASGLAWAAGQYGPGVSDTEIKIGNTMPYSGPASAYGVIGKSEAAYFAMINDQGGVNGRKINFISRDEGYSPPKTVEIVRKLVEEDKVLLLFNTLGTAPNITMQDYLNDNKVPQLFLNSGADRWNDPKHHPWTMGLQPSYRLEARIYGRYILNNLPDAKIGVLYQNDDFGNDYLMGLREGLGYKADLLIVATKHQLAVFVPNERNIQAIGVELKCVDVHGTSPHNAAPAGFRRAAPKTFAVVIRRRSTWCDRVRHLFGRLRCRFLFGDSGRFRFVFWLPRWRKCAQPIVLKTFVEQFLSTYDLNFEFGILECASLHCAGDDHIIRQWRQQLAFGVAEQRHVAQQLAPESLVEFIRVDARARHCQRVGRSLRFIARRRQAEVLIEVVGCGKRRLQ